MFLIHHASVETSIPRNPLWLVHSTCPFDWGCGHLSIQMIFDREGWCIPLRILQFVPLSRWRERAADLHAGDSVPSPRYYRSGILIPRNMQFTYDLPSRYDLQFTICLRVGAISPRLCITSLQLSGSTLKQRPGLCLPSSSIH